MQHIKIRDRRIGPEQRVYIVAEMSGNHGQDFDEAVRIVRAAKEAGADAIKLQTYTPDTITINCNTEPFRIKGTMWEGRNLYELYGEAYTPWEWQPKLKQVARRTWPRLFLQPVRFQRGGVPRGVGCAGHKIASFETGGLPLLRGSPHRQADHHVHRHGVAEEIDEAVRAFAVAGGRNWRCSNAPARIPLRRRT